MNPKIVKKLLSCYPELKSELSSTRRELRDVEHKKSDLAHPKAVSWDGTHSQNPVAQADILTGLISDEMDASQRAAALERLLETLRALRDRMEEPGRTLVTEKFFQGRTWESLQVRHGMSKAGMDYIIEREISGLV